MMPSLHGNNYRGRNASFPCFFFFSIFFVDLLQNRKKAEAPLADGRKKGYSSGNLGVKESRIFVLCLMLYGGVMVSD